MVKIIAELKSRKNQIATQIASLESEAKKLAQAIAVLLKLSGGKASAGAKAPRKRRKMPAAAIAKIRAAQKKRWAAWKLEHKGKATAPKKRKTISKANIEAIRAAQKARWAKWRQEHGK